MMKYWGIIPAAGQGTRMREPYPKQYLRIHGRYIIDYSIAALLQVPVIERIIVSLTMNDKYWQHSSANSETRVMTCLGGATRAESVYNAMLSIKQQVNNDDWVIIHDAVRPCLEKSDVMKLLDSVHSGLSGSILAVPVIDALKESDTGQTIKQGVKHVNIWQALTPQVFKYDLLFKALQLSFNNNINIEDEAMAMELEGHHIQLVEGKRSNIKVTYASDLDCASRYLYKQETKSKEIL